eukprot:gene4496-8946_t
MTELAVTNREEGYVAVDDRQLKIESVWVDLTDTDNNNNAHEHTMESADKDNFNFNFNTMSLLGSSSSVYSADSSITLPTMINNSNNNSKSYGHTRLFSPDRDAIQHLLTTSSSAANSTGPGRSGVLTNKKNKAGGGGTGGLSVTSLLSLEDTIGVNEPQTYPQFLPYVSKNKKNFKINEKERDMLSVVGLDSKHEVLKTTVATTHKNNKVGNIDTANGNGNDDGDMVSVITDRSGGSVKKLIRPGRAPLPPQHPCYVPTSPTDSQKLKKKRIQLSDDTKIGILKGFITPLDFDFMMGDIQVDVSKGFEGDDDVTEEDEVSAAAKAIPVQMWLTSSDTITSKQQVCRRFLSQSCSKTTCPLAHPGIRDSAAVSHARMPGRTNKVPYVFVCPEWPGNCDNGNSCDFYHCYIRPSTIDIIERIYPKKKEGIKSKAFASGSTMKGNVKEGKYTGYGVYTWPTGATYVGDWEGDKRHGRGIFRTPAGAEYVGEYERGVRQGWGVLYHPNGEEYIGQWENGKMHGVGRLSSANGDVYEGEFHNHKYDGLGGFTRKNGDRYLGYVKDGYAHGLGIQVLSKGEKYKGYFDRDVRHGRGACAYKNGSRYAGEWYR